MEKQVTTKNEQADTSTIPIPEPIIKLIGRQTLQIEFLQNYVAELQKQAAVKK